MPRARPKWRAPYVIGPGNGPITPALLAKRTSFGDFSPGSGRVQCEAVSKSTGERCRRDAVQGVSTCRAHKGVGGAMTKLRASRPDARSAANGGAARKALAQIALDSAPEGAENLSSDRGLVHLGRLREAFQNRVYAPDEFRRLLCLTKKT